MDGNVTRNGITADLEAMKTAGIGGAQIFDVGQGVPAGPIDYNTPEWRDLMVHAIAEGKRLGLEVTMHNCAGWSSSGAPWVLPADAMKRITSSTVAVSQSDAASTPLPNPPTTGGFYRDIAVYVLRGTVKTGAIGSLTGLGANPGPVERLDWAKAEVVSTVGPDKIRGWPGQDPGRRHARCSPAGGDPHAPPHRRNVDWLPERRESGQRAWLRSRQA